MVFPIYSKHLGIILQYYDIFFSSTRLKSWTMYIYLIDIGIAQNPNSCYVSFERIKKGFRFVSVL